MNIIVDNKSKRQIYMLESILNFLSALKNPPTYLFVGIAVMVFAPDELFFVGPVLICIFLGSVAMWGYKLFLSKKDEYKRKKAIQKRDCQVLSDYDSLDDTERDALDRAILTGTAINQSLSVYQMTNLNRKRFGVRIERGIYTGTGGYFKFQGEYFEAIARLKHPELYDKIKKSGD